MQDYRFKPARPSHIMHRHSKRNTESPQRAAHDAQLIQRVHRESMNDHNLASEDSRDRHRPAGKAGRETGRPAEKELALKEERVQVDSH